MTRKERLRQRNIKIRNYVKEVGEKNPQWKRRSIIQDASERFFISERTIEAILWREGAYSN